MKHLKSYKIYESTYEEMKSEIKEILRDCEDIGLRIIVSNGSSSSLNFKTREEITAETKTVIIDGTDVRKQVQFKEIRNNIEHLISYMKSEGYDNFTYTDSMSEFNRFNRMDMESNVLPPDDNSRESFISMGKITFRKNEVYKNI